MATKNLFDELLKKYSRCPMVTYDIAFNSFIDSVEEERRNMWKFEIKDQFGRMFSLHQEGGSIVIGPVGNHGCRPIFSLEDLDTIREKAAEMLEANAALEEE